MYSFKFFFFKFWFAEIRDRLDESQPFSVLQRYFGLEDEFEEKNSLYLCYVIKKREIKKR
jgi:hypothetical protein